MVSTCLGVKLDLGFRKEELILFLGICNLSACRKCVENPKIPQALADVHAFVYEHLEGTWGRGAAQFQRDASLCFTTEYPELPFSFKRP